MTHADEARRIVEPCPHWRVGAMTCSDCIMSRIAAALAAAERRGIEQAESALRKRADELSAADADGNCREIGTLVGAAILVSALLPAEPAAKCANPNCDGGRVKFIHGTTQETLWRQCGNCSAGGAPCSHEMTDSPYRHCRKCGVT